MHSLTTLINTVLTFVDVGNILEGKTFKISYVGFWPQLGGEGARGLTL